MLNPLNARCAVLLPVRLETRFYPPGRVPTWRLRVLIIPDAPWIDGHDPLPTADELDSLERLWVEVLGSSPPPQPTWPDSAEGRIAWQVFAARVGAARACWLFRAFPPAIQGGIVKVPRPNALRTPPYFNRIHGFPDELELWIGRGGQAPKFVSKWAVDAAQLDLSLPDTTRKEERWWSSWARAVQAGLGVEIDLGASKPDDIDVLLVTGIGKTLAEDVFAAHVAGGSLGLIEPGTPTNAVNSEPGTPGGGAAPADLAQSPEAWYEIAIGNGAPGPSGALLSQTLTGAPDRLGQIPGDGFDHAKPGAATVAGLWSVLWGHMLKDIWSGDDVMIAGSWAGQYTVPEGPVPPVRIGDLPYGVLPVTALSSWVRWGEDHESGFGMLELDMIPRLMLARSILAGKARATGTVVGADTDGLLALLGQTPSSVEYLLRPFLSKDLLAYFYGFALQGQHPTSLAFDAWWQSQAAPLQPFVSNPEREYLAVSGPQNLKIPLVASESEPRDALFEKVLLFDPFALPSAQNYAQLEKVPSLLGRMLVRAHVVTAAEVYRAAYAITAPALEPPVSNAPHPQMLTWALALTNDDLAKAKAHPSVILYTQTREAIVRLMKETIGVLDRVTRATLDSASHRVDPWVTTIPWRRLSFPQTSVRPVGAYGWVDAPRPGSPGPTKAGLLHAPSEEQAITAAILRDKCINDPDPVRWQMSLTSRAVRMAEQMAEEVRRGAHVDEVLGREVERIAGTKTLVEKLRLQFPIRTSHVGRRVCDGRAVLLADVASLGLDAEQTQGFADLRAALDAYADLLVAEGVYNVVAGRGAVAGASMEAAAGFGAPPNLEVIESHRRGRGLATSVAVALPIPKDAPLLDADASPGKVADSAVAAFVETILGDAKSSAWTWDILLPDGSVQTRALAGIGFEPIDTAAQSAEALVSAVAGEGLLDRTLRLRHAGGTEQLVRLHELNFSFEQLIAASEDEIRARARSMFPGYSEFLSDVPAPGSVAQASARRILGILGARPAVPADLVDGGLEAPDDAVRTELCNRYDSLRTLAATVIANLQQIVIDADALELANGLLRAAKWGISPVREQGETPGQTLTKAADALSERLATAPALADIAGERAPPIALAIAQLVGAEGQFPVLGRIDMSALPTKLAQADLDTEWLTINASVRPAIARLEAFQLEGELLGAFTPMHAFTNRPDDPWQSVPPKGPGGIALSSRLMVVYGPDQLPDTTAAVGVLDSWAEVVPDTKQSTSAAFGFNAPAARAPQAILVAVAPNLMNPIDSKTLVDTLLETRELAHARMVKPSDLTDYALAVPMTMLPIGLEP